MPTPRLRRADVCGLLALALSIGSVGISAAELHAAAVIPPAPRSGAPHGRLSASSAPEKERVKKPATPAASGKSGDHQDQHDDSDDSGNCFGSCLFGGADDFATSLVAGPTPPPPPVPASALEAEAAQWSVGSSGWLVAPAEVDSVGLWDAPAAPERPGIEVGSLPHGAHVVVVETHAMASGFWARVRPFDGIEPSGWVPTSLLTWEPAPKPAPPRVPKTDPTWAVRLVLGGGGVGPADLNVNYKEGGYRADVQYMRLLKRQWISGFGFGYRNFGGTPDWAYQTATTLESPDRSQLQTFELGLRAGQRYGDRSGFRFDWMLGPTLAVVNESVKLSVYDRVTPDSLVFSHGTHDQLTRWAGGGEIRANLGWRSHTGNEWGLHLGAFIFGWEGKGEHSLTSDFVHSNIHGFDIGLSATLFP